MDLTGCEVGAQRERREQSITTDRRRLCCAPDRDDGQMFASRVVLDLEFQLWTRLPADRHAGTRARRTARPVRPWLEARVTASGMPALVHFVRRGAAQRRMRAFAVVPNLEVLQFLPRLLAAQRHRDPLSAERLQRQDKAFDDGNAAVPASCAVARLDSAPPAPALEALAPELRAFVTDQVLGCEDESTQGSLQFIPWVVWSN